MKKQRDQKSEQKIITRKFFFSLRKNQPFLSKSFLHPTIIFGAY